MHRSLVGAAGAALVAGLATLALNAAQPASAQEEFRVTAQQLKINQRISQAAVRRANEALTRLDALPSPAAAAPAPQPTQTNPQQPVFPGLGNDMVNVLIDAEVVPPGEARAAEIPCSGNLVPGTTGYTLPETADGTVYEWRPLPGGGWRAAFRNGGTEPVTLTLRTQCKPLT